jgi:hypothetical protein
MTNYGVSSISWSSPIWDSTSTVHNLTVGQDVLGQWGRLTQYTTSGNDLIVAGDGTWQASDFIDGGGGVNTIQARIQAGWFRPAVKNVQRAELVADANSGTLDFGNWTGLKYVELNGSRAAGYIGHATLEHLTPGTEVNIHGYGSGSFNLNYASPVQTADVDLSNVGIWRTVELETHNVAELHLHVSGNDNIKMVTGDGYPTTVRVDGAGHLKLDVLDGPGTTIDASQESYAGGIDVSSSGYQSINILFGAGADTYKPTDLDNIGEIVKLGYWTPHPPRVVGDIEAAAIKINNFNIFQDKIDLSSISNGPGIAVTHDRLFFDHTSAQLLNGMTLQAAAEFVARNDGGKTVDVFEWQNSTYVFNDRAGNNTVDVGDGLLKIVGATDLQARNFV